MEYGLELFKSDLKSINIGPKSMKPDFKSMKSPNMNSLKTGLKPLEYFKSLNSLKSEKSGLNSLKSLKSDLECVKSGVQAPKE